MQKINVAIIGWGNVGRGCKRALQESSDMRLVGVVRRPASLYKNREELQDTVVVSDVSELKNKPDVLLLCIPSREVPNKVKEYHEMGYCTVDSYDEHENIPFFRREADVSAKATNTVSVISAGWDPGTDSVVRTLMKIVSMTGRTTTTFGGEKGGRSMGHTAAVKAIEGVVDAVALTLANGRGNQKRRVYVKADKKENQERIEKAIKADAYFVNDPTEVLFVKDINKYNTLHHEGEVERTAQEVNQKYTVEGINPEFTANVMVASARAVINAKNRQQYGAYTLLELPLITFLPGATLEEKLEGY